MSESPTSFDAQKMLQQRVNSASIVLKAFEQIAPCETNKVIQNLLTNLMHWADFNEVDFNHELAQAQSYYMSDKNKRDQEASAQLTTTIVEGSINQKIMSIFGTSHLICLVFGFLFLLLAVHYKLQVLLNLGLVIFSGGVLLSCMDLLIHRLGRRTSNT